ncbi:hypothetical protein AB0425_39485 [Actinosynnema sp. NPDC051121]
MTTSGPARERGGEPVARQVHDDAAAVAAEVLGEPLVDGVGHRGVLRGRPAEHGDAGVQRLDQRQLVQVVELVAGQRVGGHPHHLVASAVTPVVHVPAVAGGDVPRLEPDPDQLLQHLPGLTAQRRAQHHLGAE